MWASYLFTKITPNSTEGGVRVREEVRRIRLSTGVYDAHNGRLVALSEPARVRATLVKETTKYTEASSRLRDVRQKQNSLAGARNPCRANMPVVTCTLSYSMFGSDGSGGGRVRFSAFSGP